VSDDIASGQFVYFKTTPEWPTDREPELGLVLRTSSNEKADGSTDDFVELAPLTKLLLSAADVKSVFAEDEPDPNEVVGGSSTDPTGVETSRPKTGAKSTPVAKDKTP